MVTTIGTFDVGFGIVVFRLIGEFGTGEAGTELLLLWFCDNGVGIIASMVGCGGVEVGRDVATVRMGAATTELLYIV